MAFTEVYFPRNASIQRLNISGVVRGMGGGGGGGGDKKKVMCCFMILRKLGNCFHYMLVVNKKATTI